MARLTALSLLAWPVLLWVAVLLALGGLGIGRAEDGVVAAQSWRLLNAEIPHVDFVGSGPMGSAYLHLPELLLPTPLVMTGRAIGLAEVIAYSILFAILVLDRPPTRWSPSEAAGAGASVLVNLNAGPMLPPATVDGLLFVAAGALLLRAATRRQRWWLVAPAFLAFGVAALIDRPFWLAVLLAFAWLGFATTGGRWRRIGYAAVALVAMALPVAAYVAHVGTKLGVDEMLEQLVVAPSTLGVGLVEALGRPAVLGPFVAGVVALATLAWLPWSPVPRLIVQVLIAAIVVGVVADGRLSAGGTWATVLWWFAVAQAAARVVATSRVDATAVLLVAVGWIAAVMPGSGAPHLVAGTLALLLLHRGLALPLSRPRPRRVTVAAASLVILALVVLPIFVLARTEMVRGDRPAWELTADLGAIDGDLAGVRGTQDTADGLRDLIACVEDHPVSRVALVSGPPVLYPVLGLRSPLPFDSLAGVADETVRAAAASVDEAGDYLVLFTSVESLGALDLAAALGGEPVACGPYAGVWSR